MADSISLSSNSPIDYAEVLERIGGDISFLEDLLKIYFSEYEEKRIQLEKALAGNDFLTIQELGHSLKGSSANLSLIFLQKTALALETAGKELKEEAVRLALTTMDAEIIRLKKFLEDHPLS